MEQMDGWGYHTTTHVKPEKVHWQRTGTPVIGVPYIGSEWEDGGKHYLLLATYQRAENDSPVAAELTIQQWNPLRQRWDPQPVPPYLRLALILWADVILHLPVLL